MEGCERIEPRFPHSDSKTLTPQLPPVNAETIVAISLSKKQDIALEVIKNVFLSFYPHRIPTHSTPHHPSITILYFPSPKSYQGQIVSMSFTMTISSSFRIQNLEEFSEFCILSVIGYWPCCYITISGVPTLFL